MISQILKTIIFCFFFFSSELLVAPNLMDQKLPESERLNFMKSLSISLKEPPSEVIRWNQGIKIYFGARTTLSFIPVNPGHANIKISINQTKINNPEETPRNRLNPPTTRINILLKTEGTNLSKDQEISALKTIQNFIVTSLKLQPNTTIFQYIYINREQLITFKPSIQNLLKIYSENNLSEDKLNIIEQLYNLLLTKEKQQKAILGVIDFKLYSPNNTKIDFDKQIQFQVNKHKQLCLNTQDLNIMQTFFNDLINTPTANSIGQSNPGKIPGIILNKDITNQIKKLGNLFFRGRKYIEEENNLTITDPLNDGSISRISQNTSRGYTESYFYDEDTEEATFIEPNFPPESNQESLTQSKSISEPKHLAEVFKRISNPKKEKERSEDISCTNLDCPWRDAYHKLVETNMPIAKENLRLANTINKNLSPSPTTDLE